MDNFRKLKDKHTIIFAILMLLAFEAISNLLVAGFSLLTSMKNTGTNLQYLMQETLVLIGSILLVTLTGQKHIFKFEFKSFIKSQWSGAYFYFLAIMLIAINVSDALEAGKRFKSPLEIIEFIVFVLLVGLAEELVFRGIIADNMYVTSCNSIKNTYLYIILSGFIFGLSHFFNYFHGQSLSSVICQVLGTTMLGIILGAVYFKRRSIYGVALLHTLLDLGTMSQRALFIGGSVSDDVNASVDFMTSLFQTMRSQLPYLIVAFIILRPSVIKKILLSEKAEK